METRTEADYLAVFGYNPLRELAYPGAETVPAGRSVIDDALTASMWENPSPLIEMLMSEKREIVLAGLYIFSEMGARSEAFVDFAIPHLGHPSKYARRYILEGIAPHVSKLSCAHISEILKILWESEGIVQEKLVDILSSVSVERLKEAASCLEVGQKEILNGIELLESSFSEGRLRDDLANTEGVMRLFLFAKIVSESSRGSVVKIPSPKHDDKLHKFISRKIELQRRRNSIR